jgi:hypothetical protein
MANNDYQLGRLIDRLKASGEWQNTVLIVAADHSVALSFTDTAIGRLDSLPPAWWVNGYLWTRPMFRPTVGRVPLIVSWPGRIAGGRRFDAPVSLIDVLPTVLDLTGLPMPDVMQGQSLAPLLRGEPGWTPRPVIFDEFEADPETGQLSGHIEVVDGHWAASLWIGPLPANPANRHPWPLLLYDLWATSGPAAWRRRASIASVTSRRCEPCTTKRWRTRTIRLAVWSSASRTEASGSTRVDRRRRPCRQVGADRSGRVPTRHGSAALERRQSDPALEHLAGAVDRRLARSGVASGSTLRCR